MGKLIGEFRETNRKDKVTRFPFVSYARQLGLLVNTLGSHLNKTCNQLVNIKEGQGELLCVFKTLFIFNILYKFASMNLQQVDKKAFDAVPCLQD